MTNETVIAYTYVGFPNVFADPSAVDRSKVGYGYTGLFNNGVTQVPSFGQFGPSEAALVFNPGGFEAGGPSAGLYADKWMPSGSDTLTKVIGDHTLKAGVFYEWIRNAQPANNNTNGDALASAGNTFSYGNEYADLLTGNLNSYQETNKNRINDIHYNTYEFFAQDSWKATRKLTLEFGMRFTHFQPWIDGLGFGYSIFDVSQFQPTCASSPTFCGFEWHARNAAVPVGGFPTRTLFYQPRLGAAYDVHGSGKTVSARGLGPFLLSLRTIHQRSRCIGRRGHSQPGAQQLGGWLWMPHKSRRGWVRFVLSLPFLPESRRHSCIAGRRRCQGRQPAIHRQLECDHRPDNAMARLMEMAYVGNRSWDLQNTAGGAGSNINLVPAGSMSSATNPGTANPNLYWPLQGYGDLNLATNNLYSNYNALQVTWARHAGLYTIQANYTWQKALGIVSPTVDPFNLTANYGVQPTDRRNLFNAAYSIDLGNRLKVMSETRFLPEALGPGCAFLDYDNDGWMDIFPGEQRAQRFLEAGQTRAQRALQEQSRRHVHRCYREGRRGAAPSSAWESPWAITTMTAGRTSSLLPMANASSTRTITTEHFTDVTDQAGVATSRLDHQRGLVRLRQRRPAGSVCMQLCGLLRCAQTRVRQ